jgi:hypothetical protein
MELSWVAVIGLGFIVLAAGIFVFALTWAVSR